MGTVIDIGSRAREAHRVLDLRWLAGRLADHLSVLAEVVGPRPPGSPANRRATDYVAGVLRDAGRQVHAQAFRARYWTPGPVRLEIGDGQVDVPPSPFSRPCDVHGLVTRLTRWDESGRTDLRGRVVVLDGELSAGPFFPKGFPFVSLPHQTAFIAALEAARPAAVLAVAGSTSFDHEPLLEDGDLTFPYATVAHGVGEQLTDGVHVRLVIGGRIDEGEGVNISSPSGTGRGAVVLSAHLDSKATTCGALDNGASAAALLALAELGEPCVQPIEYVFFNGEDHYAAPGEQAWLADRDLTDLRLVVNMDGVGLAGHATSFATFVCPPAIEAIVAEVLAASDDVVRTEPWFQSDHAIFAMAGVPSIALTSAAPVNLLTALSHSPTDSVTSIDQQVVAVSAALAVEVVEKVARLP